MPNAKPGIVLALVGAALGACSEQATPDQNVLIDTNIPADAEFEALPPDETSGIPADELGNNGDSASATAGNADANVVGNNE